MVSSHKRPARAIRPGVRRELDELQCAIAAQQQQNQKLEKAIAELRTENKVLQQQLARRAGPSGAAAPPQPWLLWTGKGPPQPWFIPGWAMRLPQFLALTGMPRRTFYYQRERGKLRSIVLGDRATYVLTDSYLDLVRETDQEQNRPGAPQYVGANPPPGVAVIDLPKHRDPRRCVPAPATGPPP
jgi:hypothetical protein